MKNLNAFLFKKIIYILRWNLGQSWKHYCPSVSNNTPILSYL